MKILIAGLGITGKSTLRRKIVGVLKNMGLSPIHCDSDGFKEVRCKEDADCLGKVPGNIPGEAILVVEDVRGTTERAAVPIEDFDLILYVKTGLFSYILFWLPRVIAWFRRGQFAWDRKNGWKGTGIPSDPRNIIPIARELYGMLLNRKVWLKEDAACLAGKPHVIVHSTWTTSGPRFSL